MLRALALVFLLSLLVPAARAQTTTFVPYGSGGTCNPDFTVSGGLTISMGSATSYASCLGQATHAKWSGKWYYTFTGSTLGWNEAVGIASSSFNWGQNGVPVTDSQSAMGSNNVSAGYIMTTGNQSAVYEGCFGTTPASICQQVTSSFGYTLGKTIGFVYNADTNPQQLWIAADITGTSGCGGGPLWNGDPNSAPIAHNIGTITASITGTSLTVTAGSISIGQFVTGTGIDAGTRVVSGTGPYTLNQTQSGGNVGSESMTVQCGGPGAGGPGGGSQAGLFGPGDTNNSETGLKTQISGAYPAISASDFGGNPAGGIFDFTSNSTMNGFLTGGGYQNWNVEGGAPSVPGPLNPMVRNVANAPGWQQSTVYHSFNTAYITGYIAGTTLHVVTNPYGTIATGQVVTGITGGTNVTASTTITGGSGSTWTVNNSQTIGSSGAPFAMALNGATGDDRVVAGPAYNPATGLFTNSQSLWLWAVAPGGGGTSGLNSSYAANFASCTTPANIGGTTGPGGYSYSGLTQWTNATHVTDGGVTWVCLAKVDYNTLTGAVVDDVINWQPSTNYYQLQFVLNSVGGAYYLSPGNTPNSDGLTYTSGTTEPTGTTLGGTSDGRLTWYYVGNIGYSSKQNIERHEFLSSLNAGAFNCVPQNNYNSKVQIWWGGYSRREYVNGSNGEAPQIFSTQYFDQPADNGYIINAAGYSGYRFPASEGYPGATDYAEAPGDTFNVNINLAADPVRYDPTKGSALYSNQTYVPALFNPTTIGAAFAATGFATTIHDLMVRGVSGPGIFHGQYGPAVGYNTGIPMWNIIGDSGGGTPYAGESGTAQNNIIIFRNTGQNIASPPNPDIGVAMFSHYGNWYDQNTLIGPDVGGTLGASCPQCTAFNKDRTSQYAGAPWTPDNPTPVQNNLAFGWAVPFQVESSPAGGPCDHLNGCNNEYPAPANTPPYVPPAPPSIGPPYNFSYNGTDVAVSFSPSIVVANPVLVGGSANFQLMAYPGGSASDSMTCGAGNNQSCFNLSATQTFVQPLLSLDSYATPTLDLRLCTVALCGHTSPAIGAGLNWSYPGSSQPTPPADMFGQSRASRVDLGAIQAGSGQSPGSSAGGFGGFLRRF